MGQNPPPGFSWFVSINHNHHTCQRSSSFSVTNANAASLAVLEQWFGNGNRSGGASAVRSAVRRRFLFGNRFAVSEQIQLRRRTTVFCLYCTWKLRTYALHVPTLSTNSRTKIFFATYWLIVRTSERNILVAFHGFSRACVCASKSGDWRKYYTIIFLVNYR